MYVGLVKKTISIAREVFFQLLCWRNLVQMAAFLKFHHAFSWIFQFCHAFSWIWPWCMVLAFCIGTCWCAWANTLKQELLQLKTADTFLAINKQTFLILLKDVLQFHYLVLQNAKLISKLHTNFKSVIYVSKIVIHLKMIRLNSASSLSLFLLSNLHLIERTLFNPSGTLSNSG